MFVFGVIALLLGLLGLLRPESLLSILGFTVLDRALRVAGDYSPVFVTASSMASFNIGIFYILAAINDLKSFYKWTAPYRGLTFIVFTIAVGVWELTGAIATGLALRSENNK
jgi:hypothetical protein